MVYILNSLHKLPSLGVCESTIGDLVSIILVCTYYRKIVQRIRPSLLQRNKLSSQNVTPQFHNFHAPSQWGLKLTGCVPTLDLPKAKPSQIMVLKQFFTWNRVPSAPDLAKAAALLIWNCAKTFSYWRKPRERHLLILSSWYLCCYAYLSRVVKASKTTLISFSLNPSKIPVKSSWICWEEKGSSERHMATSQLPRENLF